MVCQNKKTFNGSPMEFAQLCRDHSGGNAKAALTAFLRGHDPEATDEELNFNADSMAQVALDSFEDHLPAALDFLKVSEAAYETVLELAAFGMDWLVKSVKANPAPVPEAKPIDAYDPGRLVVNNQILLVTSEHTAGAYPTVAVLLSDDYTTAYKQCAQLIRNDWGVDPVKGVWKYTMRRLDLAFASSVQSMDCRR